MNAPQNFMLSKAVLAHEPDPLGTGLLAIREPRFFDPVVVELMPDWRRR